MGEPPSATKSPQKSTPTQISPTEKSPRPILKRKGTPGSSSRLGAARFVEQEVTHESKPGMAASFLQFCAMCEKQIMTPCNSILYCSEACRRKDSAKPLTAAIITTTSPSPPTSEPPSPRAILQPRLPIGVASSTSSSRESLSIFTEMHEVSSDIDPTEWKPKLPERTHSEAFRYLSRFHRSTISMDGKDSEQSISVPPSLGNTPTTTAASSLSTSAGLASRYSSSHNGYDFNTRPLPTRQNRWYGFGSSTPKGIDLVTPHIVPQTSTAASVNSEANTPAAVDDEGLKWEKRKVMFETSTRRDDGLSVLFSERN